MLLRKNCHFESQTAVFKWVYQQRVLHWQYCTHQAGAEFRDLLVSVSYVCYILVQMLCCQAELCVSRTWEEHRLVGGLCCLECHSVWKFCIEFWMKFHWICRLLLICSSFYSINATKSSWKLFLVPGVFHNFLLQHLKIFILQVFRNLTLIPRHLWSNCEWKWFSDFYQDFIFYFFGHFY